MIAALRYRDTFAKDDGTWRFAERRLYVDWTETRTLAGPGGVAMTTAPGVHVRVVDVPERSRFEVLVDGEIAGFAEYHRRPGLIAFVHTLIDPRFEGRGLASDLIRTALSEARSEGLSVMPFCPFVRGYIARHREHVDLVPADLRAHFELIGDG